MSKVLLIDDSKFARNLIRRVLVNEGYNICAEASDGKEGLEIFKALKPDLVFCDIMMDEMDGLECLRAILEENPAANVVICTSAGDELHIREALDIGARDFLPKPINAPELIRITQKLLGTSGTGKSVSYKEIFEERAVQKGLDGKPVMDFYAAFHQFTGFKFDDKKVDEQFMREKGPETRIGVRALLSAKLSSDQAESVMNVFESLYS